MDYPTNWKTLASIIKYFIISLILVSYSMRIEPPLNKMTLFH